MPGGTSRRALTLPLTWTTQVTARPGPAPGRRPGRARGPASRRGPAARHSSSAMCGASGAISSTSGSATDRGTAPAAVRVRWLFSSVILAMAVLKRRPAMSPAHAVDRLVQGAQRRLVGLGVDDGDLAGVLVDDVAPQALQQAVLPDDGPGVPGPGHVQRAHRHLVQPQRVGAVLRADLVGRDRVLQRLAHLAQQPGDLLALVEVARRRAPRPRPRARRCRARRGRRTPGSCPG